MKRVAMAALLLGLFVYVNDGPAQVGGKEVKLKYRVKDSGKEDEITGTIQEESAEGIALKTSKGPKRIPAEDILDVDYPSPNFAESQTLRRAQKAEKDRKLEEALSQYQKIKPTTDKRFTRHVEYKIALITAKLADSDETQVKPAIELFEKYVKNHPDSWQIINVPKTVIPLQIRIRDIEGAQRILDTLSASQKLPPGLRQEVNVMTARILMEGRKYDEAEKKLADLLKTTKDEGQLLRLRISHAECLAASNKVPQAKTELQEVIAKTNNPDTKAAALNTLGECLKNNNEAREAMWNFLFVDVLYNQNKDEHYRAIKNLAEVFKTLNDNKRAEYYADLLKKDK
jgi:tetratricopeptide (TPR) repeat protein